MLVEFGHHFACTATRWWGSIVMEICEGVRPATA
jgi:hypothetical protein